jgi:putative transcriptional regulator
MTAFGKRLLESIDQARAIVRGEADPSTYRITIPADIDVRDIRRKLHLTQAAFASRFGFPLATLRDWEQGKSRPDTSARAYLIVISRNPAAVEQALQSDRQVA